MFQIGSLVNELFYTVLRLELHSAQCITIGENIRNCVITWKYSYSSHPRNAKWSDKVFDQVHCEKSSVTKPQPRNQCSSLVSLLRPHALVSGMVKQSPLCFVQ